ncbi:MAG: pyridoxal phosphate-dependent aminotransferase [Candidatus Acetothermia bacterium]
MRPDTWLTEKIQRLDPSATEEVDNEVHRLQGEGVEDVLSLGVGEPCFDTPENIKAAAWQGLKGGKTKYEPTAGDYELRKAISNKLQVENDISAPPEEIIVTLGAKFAIFLTFQAVLEPGDKVMLLDPSWVTYEPAAKLAGAETVHVPTDRSNGFQPDPDTVKRKLEPEVKLMVLNTPCNPTGAVFNPSTIQELAGIAEENGFLLLSDEPYEYLVFQGNHYSPGGDFDNVVTVNAFSKSYAMTGWRLGYLTAPPEILQGVKKIYQHSASCVNSFSQLGGIEALENEQSRRRVEEMVAGYKERRDLMLDLIEDSEYLHNEFTPQGAFYCFPAYESDQPSMELAKEILTETHVATVPGSAFGETGEGHLRLSYATSKQTIEEAFDRMEDFFSRR